MHCKLRGPMLPNFGFLSHILTPFKGYVVKSENTMEFDMMKHADTETSCTKSRGCSQESFAEKGLKGYTLKDISKMK